MEQNSNREEQSNTENNVSDKDFAASPNTSAVCSASTNDYSLLFWTLLLPELQLDNIKQQKQTLNSRSFVFPRCCRRVHRVRRWTFFLMMALTSWKCKG